MYDNISQYQATVDLYRFIVPLVQPIIILIKKRLKIHE